MIFSDNVYYSYLNYHIVLLNFKEHSIMSSYRVD